MSGSIARSKKLSIIDAARVIYRTRSPSDDQVRRVYQRMKTGALAVHDYGRTPLEWTTTEQALADFLAGEMLKHRKAPALTMRPREPTSPPSTNQAQEAKTLRSMYRGIWREYFLAVLLRRRVAHHSVRFRRAVIAGQSLLLVALVSLLASIARLTIEPTLSEHVAIDRWIGENTDRHEIVRWHPSRPVLDGGGILVEVEYRYAKDSPRTITTQRTFQVVGDSVTEVSTN